MIQVALVFTSNPHSVYRSYFTIVLFESKIPRDLRNRQHTQCAYTLYTHTATRLYCIHRFLQDIFYIIITFIINLQNVILSRSHYCIYCILFYIIVQYIAQVPIHRVATRRTILVSRNIRAPSFLISTKIYYFQAVSSI